MDDSTKKGVWMKMPSPAQQAQEQEHPYPDGWGPTIDTTSDCVQLPSEAEVNACIKEVKAVAFPPQEMIMGVWVDTDEPCIAELLHPRGERLARDANLDPKTLRKWSE
jgi:hypothetical protein